MLACIFKTPNNSVVEEYPIRELGQQEILIDLHTCGIYSTDCHISNGEDPSKPPVLIGHHQFLFKNEIKVLNSYLNPFTFSFAMNLSVNGKIKDQKIISNQTSLKEINTVFNNNCDFTSIKQQIIIN